ncbi:MAG: MBL fold metallo-hydrolase, partial [Pseudomonadota bacterium]
VPVTPLQQNCTLVWDDGSKVGAVVDPGGDVDRIMEAIEKTGITVEKIVLTHGHIDHAAGADELRERLNVSIEGPHRDDAFLLDSLETHAPQFGIMDARNVKPDRWLQEGDDLRIAGHAFDVLHCPGHSPGSVVMVQHAAKFILMGDVLFAGSVGRTDFPYGDTQALISAIKTKVLPLGDDYTFICGHGPASTIGQERASNPFIQ